MKINFIGASCRQGVSEKTGNAYTIAELLYMVPDVSKTKKGTDGSTIYTYTAHGCKTLTLPLDPSVLSKFATIKPGTEISVQLEPNPENPTRNRVTGIAA